MSVDGVGFAEEREGKHEHRAPKNDEGNEDVVCDAEALIVVEDASIEEENAKLYLMNVSFKYTEQ